MMKRNLIILAIVVMLVGCGYEIVQRPASKPLSIGRLGNATAEPGLHIKLRDLMVTRAKQKGITLVAPGGLAPMVEGDITRLEIRAIAAKDGVATSYEVTVAGTFEVIASGGQKRPLGTGAPYIVIFNVPQGLPELTAQRALAIEQALSNLAEALVDSGVAD